MSKNKDDDSENKINDVENDKIQNQVQNRVILKHLFINTLRNSVENSTSHGIPSVLRSKSWILKIFWSILFLGALAGAIYCKKIQL